MRNYVKASAALAIIAAALASCEKNGAPQTCNTESAEPISFGVSKIAATKTVVDVVDSTFQKEGASFKVAAVADSNSVKYQYFNEPVTLSSGLFKTATSYYFPQEGTLDFHAVYPTSQTIVIDGADASTAFTVDRNTDLVVASVYGASAGNGPVELVFKHALSQVKFQAKGSDAQVDYNVTSVKVVSPKDGVYNYNENSWTRGELDSTLYDKSETVYPVVASTSELTPFGEAQTYIPGETSFEIEWNCTKNGQTLASYKRSAPFTLTKGKKTTIQLTLPNDLSAEITFSVTVEDWEEEDQQFTME